MHPSIRDLCTIPLAVISFLCYWIGMYPWFLSLARHIRGVIHQHDLSVTVLLHGSGYNESEWLLGQMIYLPTEQVFTLNYANYFSNQSEHDIAYYAENVVRPKIAALFQNNAVRKLNIIGHSMGGLVGAYYNKHIATKDNIQVVRLITIGTPWRGSPLLDWFRQQHMNITAKRYLDMLPGSPFLLDLLSQDQTSSMHVCRYLALGSSQDMMVSGKAWHPENCDHHHQTCEIHGFGHYSLIIAPLVWKRIQRELLSKNNS